jgi:hypothetical protein
MRTVTCGDCGELLAADGVEPPPADRPCPKCGSIRQNINVAISPDVVAVNAGTVVAKVVDYPQVLLQEAQLLIDRRQYGMATIVAHVACEITVEQALSRAFARRSVSDLEGRQVVQRLQSRQRPAA